MTLYELIKNHQHRQRLREIIRVFYEEEFGYLLTKINLHHHLPFKKRIKARMERERQISQPERLRKAFERLGPTFIKFGQLLSLRPDLIPAEYVEEFEKMQDHVPTFPFEQAKAIIESELKKPLDKLFTSFEKKPIASASMAQVYKAKMGTKVLAVKVQRPDIRKTIQTDIELMYKIADLLEHHLPQTRGYHIKETIHEFEKWTLKELNFRIEAYYAQKIAGNFRGSRILKIPKVYGEYTTSTVLVMEFLDGVPLHDIATLKKKHITLKKIIRNGYAMALQQVFVHGFFHADPHPGNILILKNGQIGLIDFGIMGHFDKKLKRYALDLLQTFIRNDPEKAIEVLLEMNPRGDIDKEAFSKDVRDIFEQLRCTPVEELQIGSLIKETIGAANKHQVRIPIDFVLYGKTIAILEGIALRYQPDFNFMQETETNLRRMLDYKFFAREALDRSASKLSQYKELAERFPETALEILEKAKNFKINIDVAEQDVGQLTAELERSSGNLAMGAIIASLIVGSALLLQAGKAPLLHLSGFILAGVLSLWLIHRTIFLKLNKSKQEVNDR